MFPSNSAGENPNTIPLERRKQEAGRRRSRKQEAEEAGRRRRRRRNRESSENRHGCFSLSLSLLHRQTDRQTLLSLLSLFSLSSLSLSLSLCVFLSLLSLSLCVFLSLLSQKHATVSKGKSRDEREPSDPPHPSIRRPRSHAPYP